MSGYASPAHRAEVLGLGVVKLVALVAGAAMVVGVLWGARWLLGKTVEVVAQVGSPRGGAAIAMTGLVSWPFEWIFSAPWWSYLVSLVVIATGVAIAFVSTTY